MSHASGQAAAFNATVRTTVPILQPEQRWECPNCELKQVTHEAQPHTRFHACRGLKGITAPMIPAGTHCEVKANVREDYVGGDDVQFDGEGRPIMAVETVRDDGNDVAVLAPCAYSHSRIER